MDKSQSYLDYFNYKDISCYALVIKGDAMVAPALSPSLSFNPGSYIVINHNKIPEHSNYVIVTTNSKKEPILRQYIEEEELSI